MNTLNNNFQNLSSSQIQQSNNDININNIDISKPQSMKLNSTLLKDIKNNNNVYNDKIDKNINLYSLDFYALGKVHNYQKINKFIQPNNGFQSTSNNLLKRNYFSVNNRHFDDLKNRYPKKQATIYEQNIKENNYLTPINIFNSLYRYDLPSNVVNQETYNIAKEKLFAKDISSTIRKGEHLSRNDYISEKNNLMNIKDTQLLTQKNRTINDVNTRQIKRYNSCLNIKDDIFNNKENNNDSLNKEKNDINKLQHSLSTKAFIPKNPKDFTKEELKNTVTHFDKNYSRIVRDRNWWKINK